MNKLIKILMNAGMLLAVVGVGGVAGAIETGKGLVIAVVFLLVGVELLLIGAKVEKKEKSNIDADVFRVGYLPRR